MSLPELTPYKITLLQQRDTFCNNIITHQHCNPHDKYFTDSMGILHKKVIDCNSTFSSIEVSKVLIKYLLHASHDSLGHVGATKLYHFIKILYYFPDMKKVIRRYMRTCKNVKLWIYKSQTISTYTKKLHKHHKVTYWLTSLGLTIQLHKATHMPSQQFATSQVTSWQPPHLKEKDFHYSCSVIVEIFLKFSFPRILHSDNSTEFKSKLIEHLTEQLGVKKTYILEN